MRSHIRSFLEKISAGEAARPLLPALFCVPLLLFVFSVLRDPSLSPANALSALDGVALRRLGRSLSLAFWMTAFSVGWGLIVYGGYGSLPKRFRRFLWLLALIPLAYPPFGVATGWMTLLSLWRSPGGGRILWGAGGGPALWLYSVPGTAFLLSLCCWPLVFFLLLHAGQPTRSQIESARLFLSRRRRLRNVYGPAWKAPLLLASAVLFCLGMVQFEVPSLMQVDVYPLEIFIRLSSLLDESQGLVLCLPYLAAALLWAWAIRRLSFDWIRVEAESVPEVRSGRWRILFLTLTAGIGVLSCAAPVAGLLLHVRSVSLLASALREQADTVLRSLLYSGIGAALIVAGGIWFTASRRWRNRPVPAVLFLFFFCLPGILVASGCLRLRSAWPGRLPDAAAVLSLFLAYGIQYFVLGYVSGLLLWKRYGLRTEEFDSLLDLSAAQKTVYLYWPALRTPALAACLVVALFLWRDVAITTLLQPPGGETLALEYFNLLHYGSEPRTAAIGLAMMGVPLLGVGALMLIPYFRERKKA